MGSALFKHKDILYFLLFEWCTMFALRRCVSRESARSITHREASSFCSRFPQTREGMIYDSALRRPTRFFRTNIDIAANPKNLRFAKLLCGANVLCKPAAPSSILLYVHIHLWFLCLAPRRWILKKSHFFILRVHGGLCKVFSLAISDDSQVTDFSTWRELTP